MNLTVGHSKYIFVKILTGGLHRCFLRVGNILMDFERLHYEQLTDESIPLAFYYDTDIDNRPKIVEEVILYLQHRFTYFLFDSKIGEQYDFTAGLGDMDEDSRIELQERRAELMRRYLAKYEEFKKSNR